MTTRNIKRIVRGIATQDGAGVKLTRVIGNRDGYDFDPFLMLDAFDSGNPDDYTKGFPAHPHRGIETVTYLVEGEIEHGDSLGNKGVIRSGDCQWMTAGSGIIHSEMPKASSHMLGLQFWINLPQAHKMAPPKYHGATADRIPVVSQEGAVVRVIAGEYDGVCGAMQVDYVQADLLDVEIERGVEWRIETPHDATAYLYILSGAGTFGEGSEQETVIQKNAVLFTPGDEIRVRAGGNGVRFVLCMAMPLNEPVAWGGPIVMNTEQELEEAYIELHNGTFIKDKAVV